MATNPEAVAVVPPTVIPNEHQTTKDVALAPHAVYRSDEYDEDYQGEFPSEEEFHTLRRVPDKIPWSIYTIAFIELCERFSYYGTTVVFTNFIQQPLPEGSRTGAGFTDGQSGALDKGQQTSTGLTTFNQFWVYLIPLFGAYVADAHLGRYKTICIALAIAIVGHVLLIISAIPPVITKPSSSMGVFVIGLIIMGVGTGTFKPNISPLIAEQLPLTKMIVRDLPSGERVIVDPAITQNRVYNYFYLFINLGALIGQLSMVYCEKYVGFWLAFLLPTLMLCLCPLVLVYGRKKYKLSPPNGSVFSKAMRIFFLAQKGRWSINPVSSYKRLNDGTFWENVKPSHLGSARPTWMTFDDKWVDEVKRGFSACAVFCWFPIYWLTYNQLNNNLTSQAAVMKLNGLPNDVLSNLDPFALIILIPICDLFIYPTLRKYGIRFTPIKRITAGFFTGSAAMVWAAVIQAYIYKDSVCGKYASLKLPKELGGNGKITCPTVNINVWAQTGAYVLIAISEIFASITSLEYAFSKAPVNMRSLVMSVALFSSAISAALGEAFVSVSADPLLVWNYGSMAVVAFVGGVIFWFMFRGLDKEEDHLNMLPVGHVVVTKDIEQPLEEKRPVAHEIKG